MERNDKLNDHRHKSKKKKRSLETVKENLNDNNENYDKYVFDFMSMYFAHDSSKPVNNVENLVENISDCKILELNVENGIKSTPLNALKAILNYINNNKDADELEIEGQKTLINFSKPHGDEFMISEEPKNFKWLSDSFLGSIILTPKYLSNTGIIESIEDSSDWEKQQSFSSWINN